MFVPCGAWRDVMFYLQLYVMTYVMYMLEMVHYHKWCQTVTLLAYTRLIY